jgi:AcrR family transcriptional regulator
MPHPAQTNREAIIDAAQALIERDGVAQLSLASLAATLNIKAPSLYRHVASKAALIQLVNGRTFKQLFAAYAVALETGGGQADEQMRRILEAHRAFAHAHPARYILAFTTSAANERPDDKALEELVLPIQQIMAGVSGAAASLSSLRGALALAHGFVMLELHQQLRRSGDLDAAFLTAVDAYLAGVAALHPAGDGMRPVR